MLPKIYIRDKVYIPTSSLPDLEHVKKKYTHDFFNEASCATCEYKHIRPCDVCESCEHWKSRVKLWAIKELNSGLHIGLPVGDKHLMEKKTGISFSDYKIVDKRALNPFKYPIKFLLTLREHQVDATNQWLKKKYGLLQAPPRSGKTACMLYLGIELGQRFVVIAKQHEFLQQFLWHIEGNEESDIPKCTNLPELEKKHKKKLYGFPKTEEDFKNFQIMVMTYQQFITAKGNKRLSRLMKEIGFVAVDEVHTAGADTFAKVLNKLYTRYKLGVSGTMERKDRKDKLVKAIMGPVTSKITVEQMIPTIFLHDTKCTYSSQPRHPTFIYKKLAGDKKRNKLIVDWIFKDLKEGHCIVVPVVFKKHMLELVQEINRRAGKVIAECYQGGAGARNKKNREEILSRAKQRKTRVVVGIRSLLQLGLNVPTWSAIYEIIPISNEPNLKQETARVLTPLDGKKSIVRYFFEEGMGMSFGCAKSSLKHMLGFGYILSQEEATQKAASLILSSNNRRGKGSDDEFDEEFKARVLVEDNEYVPTLRRKMGA